MLVFQALSFLGKSNFFWTQSAAKKEGCFIKTAFSKILDLKILFFLLLFLVFFK